MGEERDSQSTEPVITPEEDKELAAGTCIDRYEVVRRLGAGGMGIVYEARDSRLGRLVGLKLVRPRGDAKAAEDQLLREAQAMARISHPNVVTIFDAGVFAGRLYYAMELMEGRTLRDWLKQRPRSPREIARVFLQAARGLAAAHTAGLLHRDFKPDNVLVDSDGRVRVADFGLARVATLEPEESRHTSVRESRSAAIVGTRGYIAPELLLGRPSDDRADQFAFCVTLYEALFGKGPFQVKVATDVDTRVLEAVAVLTGAIRPAKGRSVPGWLRRIILRGLSVDPAARWPSLEVVASLLDRGLRRRRWIGVAVPTVAFVAGAIALVAMALSERKSGAEWEPVVIGVEGEGNPAVDGTISQDGKVLAFTSRREVWIQRRGTAERVPVHLPEGPFEIYDFALSPGGERLFVTLERLPASEGELWRIDLPDGKAERIYAPKGRRPGFLNVAPDGQALALTEQDKGGHSRLILIGPGDVVRSLVEAVPGQKLGTPAFSPNGRRVAFVRSSPSPEASVEWVEVDTKRVTPVGATWRSGILDWSADDTLLVAEHRVSRVREILVADDGHIRDERDVYRIPGDVVFSRLKATRAGVFMQRGPSDSRPRVAVLDLASEAPRLEVLPTGSEVDWHPAGWMSNGDIVIAARVAGQDSVLTGNRIGGFKVAGSVRELGWPYRVIGDRVFYRVPGTDADTFTLAAGGLSPPLTPLTQLRTGLDTIICAGDHKEPCLLAETKGTETIAYSWDTHTGTRGREVLRWEGIPSGRAALSHDGTALAFITPPGSIVTVPLQGGPRTELTPPPAFTYRYLAWTQDGALVATRCCVPFGLVRIGVDGQTTTLAETATQSISYPVLSPDGTKVAVSVEETAQTYLWVAASR